MILANVERPHTFDEVVGQENIVSNLRQQAKKDKFFQGYTLCGQFGSGKTTIARILQLAVNCQHKDENGNPCLACPSCKAILSGTTTDIVEIDAASNTGVDNIRSLKETAEYMPLMLKKKVYIIDEVQRLSAGAFDALLKVLEEPPTHVVFVLCTTEKHKIPKPILSRTAVYQFGCIPKVAMVDHLEHVAKKHEMKYTRTALELIAKNSQGAMRNALSILDQMNRAGEITEDTVSDMLGIAKVDSIAKTVDFILKGDRAGAIEHVSGLLEGGAEPVAMVTDMLELLSDCLVSVYDGDSVSGTVDYCTIVKELATQYAASDFSEAIDGMILLKERLLKNPERTTVICGIVSMMHRDSNTQIRQLMGEVEHLKESLCEAKEQIEKINQGEITLVHTATSVKGGIPADEQMVSELKPEMEEENTDEGVTTGITSDDIPENVISMEEVPPMPAEEDVPPMPGSEVATEEIKIPVDIFEETVVSEETQEEECMDEIPWNETSEIVQEVITEEKESLNEQTEEISDDTNEVAEPCPMSYPEIGETIHIGSREYIIKEYRTREVVLDDMTFAKINGFPIANVISIEQFEDAVAEEYGTEKVEASEIQQTSASPVTEKVAPVDSVLEEQMEEKEPLEEKKVSKVIPMDLFGVFGGFGINQSSEQEEEIGTEETEESTEPEKVMENVATSGRYTEEEGKELLEELWCNDGVIESCIRYGCTEEMTDDGYTLICNETEDGPVARIIRAYQEAGKITLPVRYAQVG